MIAGNFGPLLMKKSLLRRIMRKLGTLEKDWRLFRRGL